MPIRLGFPKIRSVTIGGTPSLYNSVASAIQTAGSLMSDAANVISSDDMDNFVAAAVEMNQAKVTVGVAATLSRTQDAMFQSTLDMLV